uniref:Helicase/UvrB N-terminal domain-containing protein n=1 Tax=viral metagenome TaxID=1070528 RepID=A0A6C0LKS4_9ZZZZ
MDLQQRKLTKTEWDSIEIPVSEEEKGILRLIKEGYKNVNIRKNNTLSLFTLLKIEYSEKMEDYLYNTYLKEIGNKIEKKLGSLKTPIMYNAVEISANVKICSADRIRLEKNNEQSLIKTDIYDFVMLDIVSKLLQYNETKPGGSKFVHYYFTLFKLNSYNVLHLNRHVKHIVTSVLNMFETKINLSTIIEKSEELLEKNKLLLKYNDLTLYEHQKEIFSVFNRSNESTPKLVLYMAPTGTGKTLTPLGLSEEHKVIFVCAARHVGLALAKSGISLSKRIAFAFGCDTADDIRLHNFAAEDYVRQPNGEYKRFKGGGKKIDNSLGGKVEIMICDIKSYLVAMHYMRAFNKDDAGNDIKDNLIVYWDEPTITLDYKDHEFHSIIKRNWNENLIENMVLSSATLPKIYEINDTVADFKNKFKTAAVVNVMSYDCKKSISIVNNKGFVVLPHYLSDDYDEIQKIGKHCENNLTLLRYFDLKEIAEFITYVNKNDFVTSRLKIQRYFDHLRDISIGSIKKYYIELLLNIIRGTWGAVCMYFKSTRRPKIMENSKVDLKGNKIIKSTSVGPGITYKSNTLGGGGELSRTFSQSPNTNTPDKINAISGTSGVYVTTKDAYTLTDGPTIFLTDNVEKIASFCIQTSNIPAIVMEEISKKIHFNNGLNEKIDGLEREVEFIIDQFEKSITSNDDGTNKKLNKLNRLDEDVSGKNKSTRLTNEINVLRSKLKIVLLNENFVPNKTGHIKKWADGMDTNSVFTSNIDEEIVHEIMGLKDVEDSFKILLMMGIGVFISHENIKYTEIMKKLADEQKLYLIIASSDYIYGTNYQFCHGFLSKDLELTQEKIIQAMGRIGRTNIQQNYTVRFRDDTQIMKLFTDETDKPEIMNMNRLFNSELAI